MDNLAKGLLIAGVISLGLVALNIFSDPPETPHLVETATIPADAGTVDPELRRLLQHEVSTHPYPQKDLMVPADAGAQLTPADLEFLQGGANPCSVPCSEPRKPGQTLAQWDCAICVRYHTQIDTDDAGIE